MSAAVDEIIAATPQVVEHPVADPLHLACLLANAGRLANGWRASGFTADYNVRRRTNEPDVGTWFVIADLTIDALVTSRFGLEVAS